MSNQYNTDKYNGDEDIQKVIHSIRNAAMLISDDTNTSKRSQ